MPSKHKISSIIKSKIIRWLKLIFPFFETAFFCFFFCALVFVFMYVCKAEGSVIILLVWTFLSVVLIFLFYRLPRKKTKTSVSMVVISGCMAGLIVFSGMAIILIQLGATQRSFAEAWLVYTRENEPSGFFSFFSAEIFALLLMVAVRFFARREYFNGICAVFSITALCAGVISGNQIILGFSIFCVLLPFLLKKRWYPFVVPFILTAVFSIFCAIVGISSGISLSSSLYLNTQALVENVSPDFPLLASVPGYGYSINVSRQKHTVSLSTHPVIKVQGMPLETLYLTTAKYASWNGEQWAIDFNDYSVSSQNLREVADSANVFGINLLSGSGDVSFYPEDALYSAGKQFESVMSRNGIRVKTAYVSLLEDFYPIIPCTETTYAVRLPDFPQDVEISSNMPNVLFADKGMKKNNRAVLYYYDENDFDAFLSTGTWQNSEYIDALCFYNFQLSESERNAFDFTKASKKIAELSISLYEKAANAASLSNENTIDGNTTDKKTMDKNTLDAANREYIKAVLGYLSDGFVYSLKSPESRRQQDPFEFFLFESKTGFCSWFAGAFTILMQAQHIPCRLSEGFRVTLDENGIGVISGMNAHAWPEVFIDGHWRIFEATPVYFSENPFAYVNAGDKRTLSQLSNLIMPEVQEEQEEQESKEFSLLSFFIPVLYFSFSLILLILVILLFLRRSKTEIRIANCARRAVSHYQKRGIPSPAEIGWISWKKNVISYAKNYTGKNGDSENNRAVASCDIADKMIDSLYKV